MAEDLRNFPNPESGIHEGTYTLWLTKSALHNNQGKLNIFKADITTVNDGRIEFGKEKIEFQAKGKTDTFNPVDIIQIRNGRDRPIWVNQYHVCQVCGELLPHDMRHMISVANVQGVPLAIVIDLQRHYDDSNAKAVGLAQAAAELRQYFPGKQFSIQPGQMMIHRGYEGKLILGVAYVAEYIAVEI